MAIRTPNPANLMQSLKGGNTRGRERINIKPINAIEAIAVRSQTSSKLPKAIKRPSEPEKPHIKTMTWSQKIKVQREDD